MPLSQTGAELLFEVFSQRYERGSTIVTSNLPFDEWTSVHRCAARPAHPSRPYPGNERRQLQAQSKQAATQALMPDEKTPSSGAFLPASLMYFCSGQPMHYCSGVDTPLIWPGFHPRDDVLNLEVTRIMGQPFDSACGLLGKPAIRSAKQSPIEL